MVFAKHRTLSYSITRLYLIITRGRYRVSQNSLFANNVRTAGPIGMGEALIDVIRPLEDNGAYFFFYINLVRMFAWADSRDQSLHEA